MIRSTWRRVLGAALLRLSSSLDAVLPPLPQGAPPSTTYAEGKTLAPVFAPQPMTCLPGGCPAGCSFTFIAHSSERTPAAAGGFWIEEENPAAAGVALPEGS